ncbi:MAG: sigma-70 family RNA polymerase sigma factor [Actinomycetota bacterium]
MDLVYNLARRMARHQADAEDLVQETYMRAFEAWTAGRRPRRVEPWIATICLNAGRSWLRRASTRLEDPSDEVTDRGAPDDTEAEAVAGLQRGEIARALWQLPEEQRIAIALMDLVGFTAAETAKMIGAPRGTVLARVHRGRKRLALILQREGVTWP